MTLGKIIVGCVVSLTLSGCFELSERHVAVVGVGEVKQFPDFASFTVEINSEANVAADAVSTLNERVAAAIEAAVEFGVSEEDVKSAYFSVDRVEKSVRRPDGTTTTEFRGYNAHQALNIRTAEVHRVGELMNALIDVGVDQAYGPVFLVSDEASLFEEARSLAINDAKRRAGEYARAAGRELGPAKIIEESGSESQRLDFNLRDRLSARYRQSETGASAETSIRPTAARASRAVFTRPEEISVSISIYAKYGLE